jgi:hypothetical protein
MLDLSFIGKDGFIIQYEDIISLIGYNICREFKSEGMSDEDILADYFNRDIESPIEFINKRCDINITNDEIYLSKKALRPNALYAFKIFDAAKRNGIKSLSVYSKQESKIIKWYLENVIDKIEIDYLYGDIIPIIQKKSNCTFITSDTEIIKRFSVENVPPFALTIIDDFKYVGDVFKYTDALREKGVFVGFTGIISAGLIL